MLLLSYAFHDLKFCLSSQLKAASCARCSSEVPPLKQVNGHSFTICLMVCCSLQGDVTPHMHAVAAWSRVYSVVGVLI